MTQNQISKGILLIEGIFEDPFFNHEERDSLLSCIQDKHVLYSLDVGKSNFDEIYLRTYVQQENGEWHIEYPCIADAATCTRLKERFLRKKELKKQFGDSTALS